MKRIALAIALLCHGIGASAADLASVYAMAQKNDPTLAAAQSTRDATLESEPLARSQLLPGVTLSGDATYTDVDVKDSGPVADDDSFGSAGAALQLVQPIYRKDLLVQLDQSRDQVAQADVDYTTAEQDLIVRVTEAYFGVLSAQDTLKFTEADVKAIARQLDQAKQRFEVGLIAITDVNEAQARYDQARANVIVAQNRLDDSIESLIEITGEPTGPLADLKTSIELKPPQPASLDEWTATALQNNPGVIDYQDAMFGPVTYDLVSLLRDCYIEWPIERVSKWALGFKQQAINAGLIESSISDETFSQWFDYMGMQRHLKVLGIFARLNHRDGKSGYLNDLPLTLDYFMRVANKYPITKPLHDLFIEWKIPQAIGNNQ